MKVTKIEAGKYKTDNGYYISKYTPTNIFTGRSMSSRETRWRIYDEDHVKIGWALTLKEAKQFILDREKEAQDINDMLEKIDGKHLDYLNRLISHIEIAKRDGHDKIREKYETEASGYIRCLVECGVIDNYKTAWTWFRGYPLGG